MVIDVCFQILNAIVLEFLLNVSIALYSAIAVRDKLESLCRELQRQNKMLMVNFVLCYRSASTEYIVTNIFRGPPIADCRLVVVLWQDECKRVSTEGQSLRLDLSTRFQDAIKVDFIFLFYSITVYLSIYFSLKVLRQGELIWI